MKVAVLGESSADEAAIKILLAAILQKDTEEISLDPIRTRGWSGILQLLPIAIPRLYYHTDAEGLVVVIDSDETPLHVRSHETSDRGDLNCRLCQVNNLVRRELEGLRIIPNREPLKTAVGLAVPAIEAWYRCGVDTHVNENTWGRKLAGESVTYDAKSLKRAVYGSDRASTLIKTEKAVEAAHRLAGNLELLSEHFPIGFGFFLSNLRQW